MVTTERPKKAANGLDSLEGMEDLMPTRFSATGIEFLMGRMKGIVTALPLSTIVGLAVDEVITRRDYELEGIEPGNRAMSEPHVKRIKAGLEKHASKFVTGSFTLAISPKGVDLDEKVKISSDAPVSISKFAIKPGHEIFIIDAQHRDKAVRDLWKDISELVRNDDESAKEVMGLLAQTSIPVLILLEDDRDEISRLFVTAASTRPIPASLIAVMDREQFANRVGLKVAQDAKLLASADRLAYQSTSATGEKLYTAAAVRGAASNMHIGFKDRTPDLREMNLRNLFEDAGYDTDGEDAVEAAASEVVELLDYAAERIPGWSQLSDETLKPKDFRAQYVHGTPSGLYVIAGVICAARLSNGVDPKHVIDLLAENIEWRREERKSGENGVKVHPDFEGTLVVNEPVLDDDGKISDWKTRTAGGARTNYEKATNRIIDRLIELDDDLGEMRSDEVQIALGLKAAGKRGRPRKAQV